MSNTPRVSDRLAAALARLRELDEQQQRDTQALLDRTRELIDSLDRS